MAKNKKRKYEKKKDKNIFYIKLLSILKLETVSMQGRINLTGVIIIAGFCLIYSASDTIRQFISATEDVVKSIALKKDIYHEYESMGVVKAAIPVIVSLILCLLFLVWHEKKKHELDS